MVWVVHAEGAVWRAPGARSCLAGAGQEGDAPGAQLVEHGVGGELGVEAQQPWVSARHALPVLGEGEHLARLLGLGQVGVGVDHLRRGVVLGEERQHRAGPLRAGGHVVLLQRDLLPVVADGVEVQVEPGLARVEADLRAAPREAFQEGDVRGAPDPVGVAGQVGGLGQRAEPEQEPETGVGPEREGVRGPSAAGALEQQVRPHGMERGQHGGAGVTRRGDQAVEAQFGHGRHQQIQASVVAGPTRPGRPVRQGARLDRLGARRGPAGASAPQPLDAFRVQDRPHCLRGRR